MRIFHMLSALYSAVGAGESKVEFFKTIFDEISCNVIDVDSYPADVTIRKCFTKEEKGTDFYREAISYINDKALKEYFSDVFYDENAKQRFMDYIREHDIILEINEKKFSDAIADEFFNAITEKIYYDDSDKIVIKKSLKKIQVLFELMTSTGNDIYNLSSSVYSQFLPSSELRELKAKIGKYYKDFKNTHDEMLAYTTKFPGLTRLYELSLEIDIEKIGNPFNTPESNVRYGRLLNELLADY